MARRNKLSLKSKVPPPPKPHIHEHSSNNSNTGSIMQNIGAGMSIGAGSAMGHKVVDSIFGSRSNEVVTNNSDVLNNQKIYERKITNMHLELCNEIKVAYDSCIYKNNDCSDLSQLMMKFKC